MLVIYALALGPALAFVALLICSVLGLLARFALHYQNFALFAGIAVLVMADRLRSAWTAVGQVETSGQYPYFVQVMAAGLALIIVALYWLAMMIMDQALSKAHWSGYLVILAVVILTVIGFAAGFSAGMEGLFILGLVAVVLQQVYYHVQLALVKKQPPVDDDIF